MTKDPSVGLSLLLFEYTLCQMQTKPNVITDEIKKTELRPEQNLTGVYERACCDSCRGELQASSEDPETQQP